MYLNRICHTEDRVKFFRDEARRDTWLAQLEIKHAEFPRAIRSFRKAVLSWQGIARRGVTPGHSAFARREAAKWKQLEEDAIAAFKRVGIPRLRDVPEGGSLWEQVLLHRRDEERLFPAVVA